MSLQRQPTTKTILLVDSEPLLLKFIRMVLEREGLTVLSAASAEKALELGQDSAIAVDMLLTSVSLPGTSGPELAAQLERARPELRVMLMSSDPASPNLALNFGWQFISKPFLPAELVERIRNAITRGLGSSVVGAPS